MTTSTVIVATGAYTDLGAGPLHLDYVSGPPVYIIVAASQPTGTAIGHLLYNNSNLPDLNTTTHIWARAQDNFANNSATLVITPVISPGGGSGGDASAANQTSALTKLDSLATKLDTLHSDLVTATSPVAAGTPATAARVVLALASTGGQTSVGSSATSVTVLAANASRMGFAVFNDSTSILYLLLANSTASTTVHTAQVGAGGFFENNTYAGIVKGIWSSANGNARVTEFS